MGNSLSSSRRQPRRAAAPRKVRATKKPNRFSFGSRKPKQPVVVATPKKRFGFGSRKPRAAKKAPVATTGARKFGFGSRNKKAARHQHMETGGAPAAIQTIKAKISPSPAPVATKRGRKRNSGGSLAKKLGPLAVGKTKAAPPPAKRGFLSGLTSRRRARY